MADMACHHMDLPFWALGLRYPTSVAAEGPPVDPEGCPPGWSRITSFRPAATSRPSS